MSIDATNVVARPALIYFRQIGKQATTSSMDPPDLGWWLNVEDAPNRFPVHPAEAQALVFCQLEIRSPQEPFVVLSKAEYDVNPENISHVLAEVWETYKPHSNASQIFSVHAKAVLLRAYRWMLLRSFNASAMSATYNATATKTSDLCEAFHYPAVLKYEERVSFSTKQIETWLDFHPPANDPDPETTLLQMLCARMS